MPGRRRIWVEGEELRPYRRLLHERIHADLDQVEQRMPIGPLLVRVRSKGAPVNGDFPLIGYGPDARRVLLWPDTARDINAVLDDHLLPTLAHESHHVMRWRDGEGHGTTILSFLVAEGLATHFAASVTGNPVVLDHTAEVRDLAQRALRDLGTGKGMAEYRKWFLGDDSAGLQPGAGYRVGSAVVAWYLRENGGDPGALHAEDSRCFRAALEAVASS